MMHEMIPTALPEVADVHHIDADVGDKVVRSVSTLDHIGQLNVANLEAAAIARDEALRAVYAAYGEAETSFHETKGKIDGARDEIGSLTTRLSLLPDIKAHHIATRLALSEKRDQHGIDLEQTNGQYTKAVNDRFVAGEEAKRIAIDKSSQEIQLEEIRTRAQVMSSDESTYAQQTYEVATHLLRGFDNSLLDNQTRTKALDAEIVRLSLAVLELQATIAESDANIESIDEQIAAVETEMETIKARLTLLHARIAEIETRPIEEVAALDTTASVSEDESNVVLEEDSNVVQLSSRQPDNQERIISSDSPAAIVQVVGFMATQTQEGAN